MRTLFDLLLDVSYNRDVRDIYMLGTPRIVGEFEKVRKGLGSITTDEYAERVAELARQARLVAPSEFKFFRAVRRGSW